MASETTEFSGISVKAQNLPRDYVRDFENFFDRISVPFYFFPEFPEF